jgi:hypothetical protein
MPLKRPHSTKRQIPASGPSLQVKSLTSFQEEADLLHKTHVRSAANVSFEPNPAVALLPFVGLALSK